MFWGWWSYDEGGTRRGGGCLFLPLIFVCGSFFIFDNFKSVWLLPLIGISLAWFLLPTILKHGLGQTQSSEWSDDRLEDEKPKRDFNIEKPKRDSDYVYRDDGEVLEVVDPSEETDPDSDDERSF